MSPDDRDAELEDRLVRRAQAGDFSAFSELTQPHRASALRVSTAVLGTADGTDIIVQDATDRGWQSIDRFRRGRRPFRAWFLRIVVNRARSERRTKGRQARLALRATPTEIDLTDPSPEHGAVTDPERQRVIEALNQLPPADRLVLALRFFEQLSAREMADVLGCAEETATSSLWRAKARLRSQVERSEPREEATRDG